MGVKMHEVLIKKNFIDKKIDDIQFQIKNTKTDVDTAVRVRKTLCRKIKTLSLIIKGKHDDLDVFPFLDQRDVLVEEFILLDTVIRKSDLETEVN
jgi:hypothetical protein